jgi:hypothetical protein
VLLAACDARGKACDALVAKCPAPETRAVCAGVLRSVSVFEARRRGACIEDSGSCPEAALCLQPELKTGWTGDEPFGRK